MDGVLCNVAFHPNHIRLKTQSGYVPIVRSVSRVGARLKQAAYIVKLDVPVIVTVFVDPGIRADLEAIRIERLNVVGIICVVANGKRIIAAVLRHAPAARIVGIANDKDGSRLPPAIDVAVVCPISNIGARGKVAHSIVTHGKPVIGCAILIHLVRVADLEAGCIKVQNLISPYAVKAVGIDALTNAHI